MRQICLQVSLGKVDTRVAVNCETSAVLEFNPEKPMTSSRENSDQPDKMDKSKGVVDGVSHARCP